MITLLIFCFLSEIIDSRTVATVLLQFWALPLLIALYTFNKQTSQWVYFGVVTLITGFPYIHPVQVAWASTNSYGVGTRTVSASLYNMFVQAGGIVSVSLLDLCARPYRLDPYLRRQTSIRMTTSRFVRDALYTQALSLTFFTDKRGNRALIGITVMNIVLYLFTYLFYRGLNARRARKWNAMSHKVRVSLTMSLTLLTSLVQEQQEYLDTTTDKGNQKLNFRFTY